MGYLLELSKENLHLSIAEAINHLNLKKYKMILNYILLEDKLKSERLGHLAYTKSAYNILFECTLKDLEKKVSTFGWEKAIKGSYCVRFFVGGKESSSISKNLASIIWAKMKNPKVNLKNPKTKIIFIKLGERIFCTSDVWRQEEKFELRNPNFLPEFKPIVLKTRLARAIVNLTGAKKGDTITDPMCGIGGLLIEAGHIGCRIKGYDIDPIAIYKCRKNLEHNGIKNFMLRRKDALSMEEPVDYVVLDFPYGKNTKKQDLESLYKDFLAVLKKCLRRKAVLIFPSFIDHKKLIKGSGLAIESEFTVYVHASLSRKILVLG